MQQAERTDNCEFHRSHHNCVSSVWNLLHFTLLAFRICTWLTHSWRIHVPLLLGVSRAPLVIRSEVLTAVWLMIQVFWDVILSGSRHLADTTILSNTRTHSSSDMSHPQHHVSWYDNRRNKTYVFM